MKRPLSHYLKAMRQWLECPILTPLEQQVVQRMADAAELGEDEFWAAVEEAKLYLSSPLWAAINKAMITGTIKNWSDLDLETSDAIA